MAATLTRRDCLTVAVVAACLLGLAPAGIVASRARVDQDTCQDRLRTLGRAFLTYADVHRGLPPRRTGFNDGNAYGGWGTELVPYLELDAPPDAYDPAYDYFDPRNKRLVERQLAAFLCPASPPDRFVRIQSQGSTKTPNPDKDTVFACKAAPTDFIAANGFSLPRKGYGVNAFRPGIGGNQHQPLIDNERGRLSRITDGLSHTILLIEQAGRPSVWRNGEERRGDGQFGMSPNARGAWAGWGSIAFGAVNRETGDSPGRGDATDCTVNCNNWLGLYAFHPSTAGMLCCDGSVRAVGRSLDPLTFAYLTICNDGHLIDAGDLRDE